MMEPIIAKIEGTEQDLLERARLRECDLKILNSITSDKRRLEWLMSKVVTMEQWNLHIDYAHNGAPITEYGHISVSHGGGYVAVIFSDKPCGVDIERADRMVGRSARKYTTDYETNIVRASFPDNPEIVIWCAKEALYKRSSIQSADFIRHYHILSATDHTLATSACAEDVVVRFKRNKDLVIAWC